MIAPTKPVPGPPVAAPRVLIFGGRGYLGQAFSALYPHALMPPTDIADPAAVRQILSLHRPEVVINCAGRCGVPNVDWCEDHKPETVRSNVLGPLVLLEECGRCDAFLVHLGSGCLFTGDNGGAGFRESDPPNFTGSYYARSKASADHLLSEFPVLVLRLRMPFDGSTHERNLLMKLRRFSRLLVEKNSLTHLPDFLQAADTLIRRRAVGVFHVVNSGATSPFELMEMYRSIVDPGHAFEPLEVDRLLDVVRVDRSNCVLNTDRLRAEGIDLPPVRQAAESALRALAAKLHAG